MTDSIIFSFPSMRRQNNNAHVCAPFCIIIIIILLVIIIITRTRIFAQTFVVARAASHSHSCPGGFFQYMLYNIPSSGFIAQTLEALVGGILRSVERANENVRPARIYFNEGELLDASINRSPTSYLNNPIEERARYEHDTDKMMYLLKMVDLESNEPLAMINWFPVHGTSMNNSNHLISGDNKGYAALLFEEQFNPPGTLPGKGKFVAIFAQANEGDVSPNTRGARCVDSGLPCDVASSTCGSPARVSISMSDCDEWPELLSSCERVSVPSYLVPFALSPPPITLPNIHKYFRRDNR